MNASFFFALISVIINFYLHEVKSEETTITANTDIAPCTCDLTPNVCDLNCCCDSSCSAADRKIFSSCKDSYISENPRLCTVTTLKKSADNVVTKESTTSDDLFCIFNDNYKQRNYFAVPALLKSAKEVEDKLKSAGTSRTVESVSFAPLNNYNPRYTSGDPVYVFYPINLYGHWSLPESQGGGSCGNESPLQFLVERTASCSRTLDFITNCTNDKYLSAYTYVQSFKIVKSPAALAAILNKGPTSGNVSMPITYASSNLTSIEIGKTTCLDINGNPQQCNSTTLKPELSSDAKSCSNILKSISYNVFYNVTQGITRVTADVVVVTLTSTTIRQTLAVSFSQNTGTSGVPRSGNPGYLFDKPILAGRKVTADGKVAIQLPTTPGNWLSVVSGGTCQLGSPRMPVLFGRSMSSSCTISIKKNVGELCNNFNKIIKQALLGDISADSTTYIATFGNTPPSKPGDWIPILIDGNSVSVSSGSSPTSCQEVTTAAKLFILYAKIGSSTNPQNKIVGAKFQFLRSPIKFSCFGTQCFDPTKTGAITQMIPITMDVIFVDTSVNASIVEKAKPIYLARLPNDFFYPFLVGSSVRTASMGLFTHLICVSVTLASVSLSQLVL